MSYHAVLSPSGAHRWMACPGAPAMERGIEDSGSTYAAEGTLAHALAAQMLDFDGSDEATYEQEAARLRNPEMYAYCYAYAELVRQFQGEGALMVEQAVPIGHITGEEGASGTVDALILRDDEVTVCDLKYGYDPVGAEKNPQLMLYALGALEVVRLIGAEPARVRLVIIQPRISDKPSEWDCTVAELEAWGLECSRAAVNAVGCLTGGQLRLVPGEKQCKWCKAKATCPELARHVQDTLGADFESMGLGVAPDVVGERDDIAHKMAATGLIEDWIKAVRAEVERRLLAGTPVDGYKLVQGRQGARKWADAAAVEKLFKERFRLKVEEMYDLTLVSPTTAEKLAKAKGADGKPIIGPKQWHQVEEHITRSEGKPSVAPESDKRPALVMNPSGDFADL